MGVREDRLAAGLCRQCGAGRGPGSTKTLCAGCAEEKREYARKHYYAANREAIAERKRKYHADNREAIAERKRKYRADNREAIAERKREYNSRTEIWMREAILGPRRKRQRRLEDNA